MQQRGTRGCSGGCVGARDGEREVETVLTRLWTRGKYFQHLKICGMFEYQFFILKMILQVVPVENSKV